MSTFSKFPGLVFDDFDSRFNDGEPDIASYLCWHCKGHCFMDYVAAWVEHGDGAIVCAGNFEMYQMAIICLIGAWHSNPAFLDVPDENDQLVSRGVTSLLRRDSSCEDHQDEVGWNHRAFDPHWFAAVAFYKAHPSL